MLAVVMEGGSHMKRPWDNEPRYRSPDGRSVMQTRPDAEGSRSNITPGLHKMPSSSHMLPPIVTTAEQSLRQMQAERISASAALPPAPQPPSHPQYPSQDVSSKRPRLFYENPYQPEPGLGPPSAPGASSSKMPLSGHDAREQQQQWSVRESPKSEGLYLLRDSCQTCYDSKGLVEKVVSGLERLEAELRQVLASSPLARTTKVVSCSASINAHVLRLIEPQENHEQPRRPSGPEAGVRDSLIWASSSVEANLRLVREYASSQRALPRITVANLGMPPAHEQPSAITSAPPDYTRSFMEKQERDRLKDGHRRFGPPYQSDQQLRLLESGHPPASPHLTSSSGSVYGSGQSPMTMGASGRMLPSPSSLHNTAPLSSVQGSYSPKSSQSAAHNTHLQDLQHQISTKSLALTTLQREHDQLLAAYSRMQIRCQTLDKKSQVSDHEINTLTEEKIRLQSQVETFEAQVEELVKARDEAQKQTTANGNQYMRIMAMSSQLQVQSAEEAKRYKTDRDAWERDREGLQRRIEDLEASRTPNVISSSSEGTKLDTMRPAALGSSDDDVLSSASLDVLRNEVIRLRQSLLGMEHKFLDLRQEAEKMDHVITECTSIRERLAAASLSTTTTTTTTSNSGPQMRKTSSPGTTEEQRQPQRSGTDADTITVEKEIPEAEVAERRGSGDSSKAAS